MLLHVANTTQPDLKADPAYAKWRMVVADLTPFPKDTKTGLLIGDGVELAHGHRHWSHLFSMFPTTLLNPGSTATESNPAAKPSALHSPLALQSLDHYAAMNGAGKFVPTIQNVSPNTAPSMLFASSACLFVLKQLTGCPQGFPRAVIATMSGQAGRADAAYRNLSNWFLSTSAANSVSTIPLARSIFWPAQPVSVTCMCVLTVQTERDYPQGYGGGSFGQNLGPNTMYQEAQGAPCNESPLGAAFAIQSWLLSSWRFGGPESALSADAIRVFQVLFSPAVSVPPSPPLLLPPSCPPSAPAPL